MPNIVSSQAIAAAVAFIVGTFLIRWVMSASHRYLIRCGRKAYKMDTAWAVVFWLGVTERILYIIAIFAGVTSWIAVWLGLKVAGNWRKWSHSAFRTPYDLFLLGNALSLLLAILCAWLLGWRIPPASRSG